MYSTWVNLLSTAVQSISFHKALSSIKFNTQLSVFLSLMAKHHQSKYHNEERLENIHFPPVLFCLPPPNDFTKHWKYLNRLSSSISTLSAGRCEPSPSSRQRWEFFLQLQRVLFSQLTELSHCLLTFLLRHGCLFRRVNTDKTRIQGKFSGPVKYTPSHMRKYYFPFTLWDSLHIIKL